jgi:hypothetical protein
MQQHIQTLRNLQDAIRGELAYISTGADPRDSESDEYIPLDMYICDLLDAYASAAIQIREFNV